MPSTSLILINHVLCLDDDIFATHIPQRKPVDLNEFFFIIFFSFFILFQSTSSVLPSVCFFPYQFCTGIILLFVVVDERMYLASDKSHEKEKGLEMGEDRRKINEKKRKRRNRRERKKGWT